MGPVLVISLRDAAMHDKVCVAYSKLQLWTLQNTSVMNASEYFSHAVIHKYHINLNLCNVPVR